MNTYLTILLVNSKQQTSIFLNENLPHSSEIIILIQKNRTDFFSQVNV